MNLTLNAASSFGLAWVSPAESASRLRGEAASLAIGIILLTFALTGIALYFLRSKMRDRSLLLFSVFALLYAIRLIFRQMFFQSLVPLPAGFWIHCDEVVDNFIVVPYTLFLIEIVPARWKTALRWILAFQIVFATARFSSQLLQMGRRPIETAYPRERATPALHPEGARDRAPDPVVLLARYTQTAASQPALRTSVG